MGYFWCRFIKSETCTWKKNCVYATIILRALLSGASGKRWSAETEVRKWEEKPPISVWCLIDSRMCVLRPCRQKGAQSLRCESRVFGSRTVASVTIAMCMWQPEPNQDQRWVHGQPCGFYAPGMSWQWCRYDCCYSSSPMAQPATKLLQRH